MFKNPCQHWRGFSKLDGPPRVEKAEDGYCVCARLVDNFSVAMFHRTVHEFLDRVSENTLMGGVYLFGHTFDFNSFSPESMTIPLTSLMSRSIVSRPLLLWQK